MPVKAWENPNNLKFLIKFKEHSKYDLRCSVDNQVTNLDFYLSVSK